MVGSVKVGQAFHQAWHHARAGEASASLWAKRSHPGRL